MSAIALDSPLAGVKNKTCEVFEWAAIASRKDPKRSILSIFAWIKILRGLWSVHRLTSELIDFLNSPAIDAVPDHKVKSYGQQLKEISDKLSKVLAVLKDYRASIFYAHLLACVEQDRDHILSIVEGLYLSANPTFHELIDESVHDLAIQGKLSSETSLVGKV